MRILGRHVPMLGSSGFQRRRYELLQQRVFFASVPTLYLLSECCCRLYLGYKAGERTPSWCT
jgi:hypothetical protein